MILSIILTVFVLVIPALIYYLAKNMYKRLSLFTNEVYSDIDKLENKDDSKLLGTLFGYANTSVTHMQVMIDLALTIKYLVESQEAKTLCDKISNYKF